MRQEIIIQNTFEVNSREGNEVRKKECDGYSSRKSAQCLYVACLCDQACHNVGERNNVGGRYWGTPSLLLHTTTAPCPLQKKQTIDVSL